MTELTEIQVQTVIALAKKAGDKDMRIYQQDFAVDFPDSYPDSYNKRTGVSRA